MQSHFLEPIRYAQNVDQQLRSHIRDAMHNKKIFITDFRFIKDFKLCMQSLEQRAELIEDKDHQHIEGFIKTVDRYLEMLEHNAVSSKQNSPHQMMRQQMNELIDSYREKQQGTNLSLDVLHVENVEPSMKESALNQSYQRESKSNTQQTKQEKTNNRDFDM